MAQLQEASEHIAQNTEVAASSVSEVKDKATEGHGVVVQNCNSISAVSNTLRDATKQVNDLADQSQSITSVLEVISSIADQTNLLALNAAIESARAGEHGRGFAVVADEVRSLAGRTQQCTEEIGQTLEALQAGGRQSTETMECANGSVEATVQSSESAFQAFDKITGAMVELSAMIEQTASAAEEQSHISVNVNQSVKQVTGIADNLHQSCSKTSETFGELSQIAQSLQRQLGRFKL